MRALLDGSKSPSLPRNQFLESRLGSPIRRTRCSLFLETTKVCRQALATQNLRSFRMRMPAQGFWPIASRRAPGQVGVHPRWPSARGALSGNPNLTIAHRYRQTSHRSEPRWGHETKSSAAFGVSDLRKDSFLRSIRVRSGRLPSSLSEWAVLPSGPDIENAKNLYATWKNGTSFRAAPVNRCEGRLRWRPTDSNAGWTPKLIPCAWHPFSREKPGTRGFNLRPLTGLFPPRSARPKARPFPDVPKQ